MGLRTQLRRVEDRIRLYSQNPSGHVVLLLLATVAWTALWAWFDIMVVRLAFPPPNSIFANNRFYWLATWNFMFPLATMLAFREHAWLPILAVVAGAWEDILFYWLLGESVLVGSGWTFYVRGAVFLPLCILGEIASHRLPTRRRLLAVAGLLLVAAYFDPMSTSLLGAAIVVYLAYRGLEEMLRVSGSAWSSGSSGPR